MKPQTDKHTVVWTNKLYYKIFFFLDVMVKVPVLSPSLPMSLVIPVPTPPSILRFTMDVFPKAQPPPRNPFQLGSFKEAVISYGKQEYLIHQRDLSQRRVHLSLVNWHQRQPLCPRQGSPSPHPQGPPWPLPLWPRLQLQRSLRQLVDLRPLTNLNPPYCHQMLQRWNINKC